MQKKNISRIIYFCQNKKKHLINAINKLSVILKQKDLLCQKS